jgi:anti-sigma B factor antagonist
MGEALTIRVRRDRGYVIVAVAGEVDIATVTRLRERLFELAASGRTLVVDLDQVSFIDSAGLAALVGAARRAAAHGASLQVVCARPRTRQLFRLTGLDGPVPLARTLAGPGRRPGPGGRDAAPAAAGGSVGMCSAARWSPRPGG